MSSAHNELKGLQVMLNKAEAELALRKNERAEADRRIGELTGKIGGYRKRIQELNERPTLTFSEHSLLRYAERVLGLDAKKVYEEMVDDKLLTAVKTLGDGEYPAKLDGYRLVVKGGTVVTVVGPSCQQEVA